MVRCFGPRRNRAAAVVLSMLVAASAAAAYDDSRISQAAAEKMERVLRDVLKKKSEGKPVPKVVVFTEKELNSYLYYKAGTQLPPNLKNIDLKLMPGSVVAQADLDLSQAKTQSSSQIPDMLKRPLPLYLSGELTTHKGWGYFQAASVRVGLIPLPIGVLDSIVRYVTEHQTGKAHSINDWFALPYGIKEVRLQKEKIIITP